jgi:UDP-N-acetylmuramoyl-tripeptide--D-alanyl-D-alanine ligase
VNGTAAQRAAIATGAQVINESAFPAELRVVTDTRAIEPGDTFVALRGDRYDGHTFVEEAYRKGAAAFVVEDRAALPPDAAGLVVADTKRAYMELAGEARRAFGGKVIGITGSAGKTTTKHLLAQLLVAYYGPDRVLATPANENNEIGVSKLLLRLRDAHSAAVVEMGARHEGEIAELVAIAHPHVGVLTNIGEAHVETFGSPERLARTKWGLFSNGAQPVLNARDSESVLRASALGKAPVWFGSGEPAGAGVYVRDNHTLLVNLGERTSQFYLDLRLPGAHNRANLAAALAAAMLSDIPAEALVETIPALTLPAGRYESIQLASGARLIYDAYNANASGMIAALNAFSSEEAQRHVAVLASMAELGSHAPALHERVGAHAASTNVDMLLVGGEFASSMAAGAMAAGLPRDRILSFESNAEAAHWLARHVGPRDAVLLKGSRKYKMEEIVAALRVPEGDGAA